MTAPPRSKSGARTNSSVAASLSTAAVRNARSSAAKAVRGGAASYKGLDEIGAAMREWVTEWGWWSISADKLIDVGDRVVVVTTLHASLKDGRGEVHDQGADVITLRDGKVICMEIYDTPEEALGAVGLGE